MLGRWRATLRIVACVSYTSLLVLTLGNLVHHVKAFVPAAERTIPSNKKAIDKAGNDVKEWVCYHWMYSNLTDAGNWLPILKAESDNDSFPRLSNRSMIS
jgi:hypothetical protein